MRNIISLLIITLLAGCATKSPLPPLKRGEPLEDFTGYAKMKGKEIISELPQDILKELTFERREIYNNSLFSKQGELQKIKQIIDYHFRYVDDNKLYGVREDWRAPLLMARDGRTILGDCDDYAILAMSMLGKRDISANLILAYIEDSKEFHVVTEHNGWMIDNRSRFITRYENSSYKMVAVLTEGQWFSIAKNGDR